MRYFGVKQCFCNKQFQYGILLEEYLGEKWTNVENATFSKKKRCFCEQNGGGIYHRQYGVHLSFNTLLSTENSFICKCISSNKKYE